MNDIPICITDISSKNQLIEFVTGSCNRCPLFGIEWAHSSPLFCPVAVEVMRLLRWNHSWANGYPIPCRCFVYMQKQCALQSMAETTALEIALEEQD